MRSLDRYRLLGREFEVEFARGDRKSMVRMLGKSFSYQMRFSLLLLAPSEMRAREKESRHGGRGGDSHRRGGRSRRYVI